MICDGTDSIVEKLASSPVSRTASPSKSTHFRDACSSTYNNHQNFIAYLFPCGDIMAREQRTVAVCTWCSPVYGGVNPFLASNEYFESLIYCLLMEFSASGDTEVMLERQHRSFWL